MCSLLLAKTSCTAGSNRGNRLGRTGLSCTARRTDLALVHKSSCVSIISAGEELKRWIASNGGYIHPSLVLSEDTQCGSRGIVACSAVSDTILEGEPIILVPERLFLTSELAMDTLKPQCLDHGLPKIECLDAVLQLSLLLAIERSKGDDSFWWPYITALPQCPPCAWLMTQEQLQRELASLGAMGSEWGREVSRARTNVDFQAEAVAEAFGRHFGVNAEEIRWAMGQVLSRCFGGEENVGLLPFIDLCNHAEGASPPDGHEDDDDSYAIVTSTHMGQPRPLNPADELFISYLPTSTPLKAFLSFGFVPQELRR